MNGRCNLFTLDPCTRESDAVHVETGILPQRFPGHCVDHRSVDSIRHAVGVPFHSAFSVPVDQTAAVTYKTNTKKEKKRKKSY